jgi:hypothetical protein
MLQRIQIDEYGSDSLTDSAAAFAEIARHKQHIYLYFFIFITKYAFTTK